MNKNPILYWFIRFYEYTTEIEDYSLYDGGLKNRHLIDDTVIMAKSRDEAKQKAIELYGEHPFNLTKKNKVDGFRYFYLAPSNKHWYDYHNLEVNAVCHECRKEIKVTGKKNVIRGYIHNNDNDNGELDSDVLGYFCSVDCKKKYKSRLSDQYNKDRVFRDSHLLVGCAETLRSLVGYIYRITNKHTGLSYIGQTKDSPVFRWYAHLKEDDNKFQRDNITDLVFEVLEVVLKPNSLSEREQYYIELYDSIEHGYNKRNEVSSNSG